MINILHQNAQQQRRVPAAAALWHMLRRSPTAKLADIHQSPSILSKCASTYKITTPPLILSFRPPPPTHVRCNPRLVSRPRAQQDLLRPADEFMLLETSEGDGWKERRSDLRASRFSKGATAQQQHRTRSFKPQKTHSEGCCGAARQPQWGNLGWKRRGTLKPSLDQRRGSLVLQQRVFFLFIIRTEGGTNLWWSELSASVRFALRWRRCAPATPTTRMQPKMFREKLNKSPVYTHSLTHTHTHPSPPSLAFLVRTHKRARFASGTGLVCFSNVNRPVSPVSVLFCFVLFFANQDTFACKCVRKYVQHGAMVTWIII